MNKPKKLALIIIYGAAGAGKTTLADFLSDKLAYTAHIGVDHIKRFISEFRTVPSHSETSRMVINTMASEYLKNDVTVIVEQGMTQSDIEVLEKIAKENSADFFVFRLDATRTILDERADKRHTELKKPLIPKEVLDDLHAKHNENRYPNTKVFDSGIITTEEIADQILKDIL